MREQTKAAGGPAASIEGRLLLRVLLTRLRVDPRVRRVGDFHQERKVIAAERSGVVPPRPAEGVLQRGPSLRRIVKIDF